jgi:hypothetical protein
MREFGIAAERRLKVSGLWPKFDLDIDIDIEIEQLPRRERC